MKNQEYAIQIFDANGDKVYQVLIRTTYSDKEIERKAKKLKDNLLGTSYNVMKGKVT